MKTSAVFRHIETERVVSEDNRQVSPSLRTLARFLSRLQPQRGCAPKPRVGPPAGLPWENVFRNAFNPNGVVSQSPGLARTGLLWENFWSIVLQALVQCLGRVTFAAIRKSLSLTVLIFTELNWSR